MSVYRKKEVKQTIAHFGRFFKSRPVAAAIKHLESRPGDAISKCLDRWEDRAFDGLEDIPGGGRPRKTTAKEDTQLCRIVEHHPQESKRARLVIHQRTGKTLSAKTIRRRLKEQGYSFKRVAKTLADTPIEQDYERSAKRLGQLEKQHRAGEIHLAYSDASGFSLAASSMRAWQHRDRPLFLPVSSHRQRLNVFGFLTLENAVDYWIFEENINDDCVIAATEAYIKRLRRSGMRKPIVIVWDNFSGHHSAETDAARERWARGGVSIEFLPPYSPKLNRIEILWQRIKQVWLPLKAYTSFTALRRELFLVLNGIGTKYRINFVH